MWSRLTIADMRKLALGLAILGLGTLAACSSTPNQSTHSLTFTHSDARRPDRAAASSAVDSPDDSAASPSLEGRTALEACTLENAEAETSVSNGPNPLGYFDVELGTAPEVPGCSPPSIASHLNLRIEEGDDLEIETRISADFSYPYLVDAVRDTGRLRVPGNPAGTPELRLTVNSDGQFTGCGEAIIGYTCVDGTTTTRRVSTLVRPDETPPRMRLVHDFPTDSATQTNIVPVGILFHLAFSELVETGQDEHMLAPVLPDDLTALVEAVDVDTGAVVRTRSRQSFGGAWALEFVDYEQVKNHDVRIDLKRRVHDLAGNAMAASEQLLHVMDVGETQSVIDFDDGNYVGAYGNARYVSASDQNSECESGACIVFEEQVPPCDDWQASCPSSSFNFRLALPDTTSRFRVRSRLLSTHAVSAAPRLWWHAGCNLAVAPAVLPELVEPEGTYTHGTAWQDTDMSLATCLGNGDDTNVAITLTCMKPEDMPTEGARVRYVIERIERI